MALDVATRLAKKLKKDHDFHVTLTRTSDQLVGLNDRVQIAEKAKGDLFVSIHVNSSPDAKARGAEFYFQNQLATDEEAMFLAHRENTQETTTARYVDPIVKNAKPSVKAILEDLLDTDRVLQSSELAKALKGHWKGHKKTSSIHQAPFHVVSLTHIPATLVELGFATNADDYNALTDDSYLELAAQSLYEGLKQYKDSMDKSFPGALKYTATQAP